MGEIITFPAERARPTPLTKKQFITTVRLLRLPRVDDDHHYRQEPLSPEEIERIPPFIRHLFPEGAINLAAARIAEDTKIVLYQESNNFGLPTLRSIGVTATPDVPLYPMFYNIPSMRPLPPEYNPENLQGRENTMRLAGILLNLAKDKFGR